MDKTSSTQLSIIIIDKRFILLFDLIYLLYGIKNLNHYLSIFEMIINSALIIEFISLSLCLILLQLVMMTDHYQALAFHKMVIGH